MDLPSLAPIITKLLEQGGLTALALYAAVTFYKKLMESYDKRLNESMEREKTITIALQEVGSTMKEIMITMEHKHDRR